MNVTNGKMTACKNKQQKKRGANFDHIEGKKKYRKEKNLSSLSNKVTPASYYTYFP